MTLKVLDELKSQLNGVTKQVDGIMFNPYPSLEQDMENLEYFLYCFKQKVISFKKNTTNRELQSCSSEGNRKKDRKNPRRDTQTSSVHSCEENHSKMEGLEQSLNDSQSSTTSTRSRRAAAQAAGHKLAQVQSFMNQKKLRRPSDFDEKKMSTSDLSLPPSKTQKIHQKKCAERNSVEEKENLPTSPGNQKNQSRSLLRSRNSYKRTSEDLFSENDDVPLADSVNIDVTSKTVKGGKKKKKIDTSNIEKVRSKKGDYVTRSSEKVNGPAAQSSPIYEGVQGEFRGFDVSYKQFTQSNQEFPHQPVNGNGCVIEEKGKLNCLDKTFCKETSSQKNQRTTSSSKTDDSEVEIYMESKPTKSKTNRIKKQRNEVKRDEKEEEKLKKNDNTFIVDESLITEENVHKNKEANRRTRTKKGKKTFGSQSSLEESPVVERTRTRTLRVEQKNQDNVSETTDRSRTRTIRKEKINQDNVSENISKGLAIESKSDKKTAAELPRSQAAVKGDLVKKRVEDFEKKHVKKSPEDNIVPGGRVTRNASKSKASECKVNRCFNSASLQSAVVQKLQAEELEKKLKEEKRLQMQAREEEAQRKRENALRAQAEEAKRKREEKYQKVVAAKEAAKREKAEIAEKVERSKEDKMKTITAEKEKKKEEILKKKLLAQQKALEHEERRKQEEAARLAKLKEQEEEHKRAMAMKERELEAKKMNKPLKVAPQFSKITKAEMHTPVSQAVNSYEITPSRDERPLLKPKSENDYGIDDANSSDESEDESCPKKQIPSWARSENRHRLVTVSAFVPDTFWEKFMECNPCMPDVTKMFAGVPVKKRIRTSSAVWTTPPLAATRSLQV